MNAREGFGVTTEMGELGFFVIGTAGLYGAAEIIAIDLDANRIEW